MVLKRQRSGFLGTRDPLSDSPPLPQESKTESGECSRGYARPSHA